MSVLAATPVKAGAFALAAALLLAGCGGDDAVTTEGNATASAATTSPRPNTPRSPTPTQEESVPAEESPQPTAPGDETTSAPDPDPTRPERTPPQRLTPTPDSTRTTPMTGEVPAELLDEVTADARQRAGGSRQDVQVTRAEAVTWSDGSLGCPEPGMSYTQALVNGYWVELEVAGEAFDYRLNHRGAFKLCTSPTPKPPAEPGTT